MRVYEIMFIVNPNTLEEEIDKINGQIEGVVTSGSGRIQKIEKLGRRRLAYPVKKFSDGFYVLFRTEANGEIIREIERRLRVIDSVIKYITVRMDDEIRRIEKARRQRQKRASRIGARQAARAEQAAAQETSATT